MIFIKEKVKDFDQVGGDRVAKQLNLNLAPGPDGGLEGLAFPQWAPTPWLDITMA